MPAAPPRFTPPASLRRALDQSAVSAREDPVHSSRRALGSAKLPASDLNNVNRLHVLLACVVGVVVGTVIVQAGINSKTQVVMMKLPGDLFMNVMLCVVVPTVFLNSILASMHFWTLNKAKALGIKMLAFFFATTLWASTLGVLAGVCTAPLFSPHNLTKAASAATLGKAPVVLRCPSSENASVVLDSASGGLRCQPVETAANGTAFLLQDLSNTFRLRTDLRDVLSLSDAMVQLFESFFPANAIQSFLKGDVLSVIIMGIAIGIALIHRSTIRTRENTPGFRTPAFGGGDDNKTFAGQIFLLVMQGEVILSMLLRSLLKSLPMLLVQIVAGGILEADEQAPKDSSDLSPSTQDLVTLMAVVIFALLLELATIMAMTMMVTKSNPFRFMAQLFPAQLVALGTSSSLVALPTTVRSIAASKQVSMPLAHFVCSTGTVLNKNGSALYLSAASVYILVTSGFRDEAMNAGNLVLLTVMSALLSFIVPPMPRGNLALIGTVLTGVFGVQDSIGLARMVAFLTTMDWLLDPFVTVINVTINCLVSLILAVQMDETFIEHGMFEAVSDTQEEDSNDGFPLDESDQHIRPHASSRGTNPYQHQSHSRSRTDTHGSGTMRPPMVARMTSVGESVCSA